MPLRKLDKTRKTAPADGRLTAPAAEGWEAVGGGGGDRGEDRAEEGATTNQTKAVAVGRDGDAEPPPPFVDGHHDVDGNCSDSGLLPSTSRMPSVHKDGGDVVAAKNGSLRGQAAGEPGQYEAQAAAGAAAEEEQEAMESGERGEEALTQPLLGSTAPAWN